MLLDIENNHVVSSFALVEAYGVCGPVGDVDHVTFNAKASNPASHEHQDTYVLLE